MQSDKRCLCNVCPAAKDDVFKRIVFFLLRVSIQDAASFIAAFQCNRLYNLVLAHPSFTLGADTAATRNQLALQWCIILFDRRTIGTNTWA